MHPMQNLCTFIVTDAFASHFACCHTRKLRTKYILSCLSFVAAYKMSKMCWFITLKQPHKRTMAVKINGFWERVSCSLLYHQDYTLNKALVSVWLNYLLNNNIYTTAHRMLINFLEQQQSDLSKKTVFIGKVLKQDSVRRRFFTLSTT